MKQPSLSEMSAAYSKYLNAPPQSKHITVEESEQLARDLAHIVRANAIATDLVVGIANGAVLPTKVVAELLCLPWYMVKVRRKGSRYKQRLLVIKEKLRIPSSIILWGPFRALWVVIQNRTKSLEHSEESFGFDVKNKRVLLIDDCLETGASIDYVRRRLQAAGAASVQTAVYCWVQMTSVASPEKAPDLFLHRQIQFYPWSNNSRHLQAFQQWLVRHQLELWE